MATPPIATSARATFLVAKILPALSAVAKGDGFCRRAIRPKIRQQLQILRDLGFVKFLGGGRYRR